MAATAATAPTPGSQAWLDLSRGPVVLSVPDTKGRYYLMALLDAYTNVAGSIGKRTTGTEARKFAILGPNYKGPVPEGTSEVRSPTNLAWIFGSSSGSIMTHWPRCLTSGTFCRTRASNSSGASACSPRATCHSKLSHSPTALP